MSNILKPVTELSRTELNKLYQIYNETYVRKGIGYPQEKWEEELFTPYHKHTSKQIQITIGQDNNNNFESYTIFTDQKEIEGELWSKMLESGVLVNDKSLRKPAFLNRLTQLTTNHPKQWFFSEVGIEYLGVIKKYDDSDFKMIQDKLFANTLMNEFLGSYKFTIKESDLGCIVSRDTKVKQSNAYLLTNKSILYK
jgi:hypothetical protein